MNEQQTIKFILENSSEPVIKNKVLRAALSDDLEPGSLKDEMKGNFDPSQETYEEYLQRINLERPFNMAHGGRIGFLKGKRVKDKIFKYPYSNQHGTFYSDKPVDMDRSQFIDYEKKITNPGTKKLKIAETKYSKQFGNKKGMDLWKAIGMVKRSNIVEEHVTGGTPGIGKPTKNMLSKTDFIELVKNNRNKTYNEFVEIIKKYKTKDGNLFTKDIVADRLRAYNLSGSFQKEPPKGSSNIKKAEAEKKRRLSLKETDPIGAKGTSKFNYHHVRQIAGGVPLTTDDVMIINQKINSQLGGETNKALNRISEAIQKNNKLALEAMNAKNEGAALDYMKRVDELNNQAEKIVNSAIDKLPKKYKNYVGFNQFTLPTNEYGLPISNEPMIIKKIGGMPVTKDAVDLTTLDLKQEKEFKKIVKAQAEAGKTGPINAKNFKKAFNKTFQDLSPRSIAQLAKEHGCKKFNEGGSFISCLTKKFDAAPEKFLKKSLPLAKDNANLYKWFKRGRNVARGAGVFAAWEAALAPIIAGWGKLAGDSNERILHDLFYGPILEGVGVPPKYVPGKSTKEEFMKEAGGNELAYTMKQMGELETQELPSLYQQLNKVINDMAHVPGKSPQQLWIEKDIEEKELELQKLYNTPEFYEGPAGGQSAGGDYGYNEPVIQDAYALEQLATEKIAADTAERKKAAFDWLREKKLIANRNWQSQLASGGIVSLNVKR